LRVGKPAISQKAPANNEEANSDNDEWFHFVVNKKQKK